MLLGRGICTCLSSDRHVAISITFVVDSFPDEIKKLVFKHTSVLLQIYF